MYKKFRGKFIFVLSLFSFLLVISAKAQLDPTFGTNGKTAVVIAGEDRPLGSFLLPGGKILVVNGNDISTAYHFLRFNANGTPDLTYGVNGQVTLPIPFISPSDSRSISNAIRQSDGKIVLVGSDNNDGLIVRFNDDGALDTSFSGDGIHRPNIDQTGSDGLTAVFQQSDGKLVAAGRLRFSGQFSLIRYETNGNLDSTFGDQGGFIVNTVNYPLITSIAPQSNGRFLVFAPSFSGPDNSGAVYRLNSNGTLDNSFTVPSFPGEHIHFLLLGNQKFLVGGFENKTDNLFRSHTNITIRRYNADGTLDLAFGANGKTSTDVTSAMSDDLFALAEQTDGKIVVGGRTNVEPNRSLIKNGQLSLVRLNVDGSLDGKYLVTEAESFFGNLLIQPDGRIITLSTVYDSNFERDLLLTRNDGVPVRTYRFHGVPFQFSFGSNFGFSSATVYRPSERKWYSNPDIPLGLFFGRDGDILAPSDFFGSFNTEVAVFRPSTGTWYIGKDYGNPAQNFVSVQWGTSGDIPAPADFDGDGKSDVAVFRPSNGVWYVNKSLDNSYVFVQWGLNGDKPVVGDYDGDGFYDIAVWRPGDGVWYILRSSDGQAAIVHWGLNTDVPVQEDYDGDGKFDIAVWRPSTGVWYVLRSSDSGLTFFNWGLPTDIAVPADYDGDLKTDFAVWRPSNRNWYINYSSSNSYVQFPWGLTSDIPVQGKF